jgi:hypothetical protein
LSRGAGECSELAPNRYRTRFALGRDSGAYMLGLARLLERVRHWRATMYEDDEPVSADHAREMAWCASAQLKAFGQPERSRLPKMRCNPWNKAIPATKPGLRAGVGQRWLGPVTASNRRNR